MAITIALAGFLFLQIQNYLPSKTFSVPGQRVDSGKSAALYEKWDGKGDFVDMIWR